MVNSWLLGAATTIEIILGFDQASEYRIYPNPTPSTLHIESEQNQSFSVFMKNLEGKTVMTTYHFKENTATLDLSEYPSGIYLLNLTSEKGELNWRVIKR